jgi:hypothetical protein
MQLLTYQLPCSSVSHSTTLVKLVLQLTRGRGQGQGRGGRGRGDRYQGGQ